MALLIRAKRNYFGTSEKLFYAQASCSGIVECEDFIDRMAASRTTLSKPDILAVFELAREVLCELLADGRYVKTPLGAALPVAKGNLISETETFRPRQKGKDHELRIDFRIDSGLEAQALASIKYRRADPIDRLAPLLLEARPLALSGEDGFRSGGLIKISGKLLKFDPADDGLGLFFRDRGETETRATAYIEIGPSAIIAAIPACLGSGEYRVVVRTRTRAGKPREGTLAESIAIE